MSVNTNTCSTGLWCLNNANVRSLAFLNQVVFKYLSLGDNKTSGLTVSCLLQVGIGGVFSALVLC